MATVRPPIQPSSRSRCTKAATRWFSTEAVIGLKNPMVGSFRTCRCFENAYGIGTARISGDPVVRSKGGGVMMPVLLGDLLLFLCLAAFVTGIVIAVASLLS
jgi:hypothetical protein